MAKAEIQKTLEYRQEVYTTLVPFEKNSGVVLSLTMDEALVLASLMGLFGTWHYEQNAPVSVDLRLNPYALSLVLKGVAHPYAIYDALKDAGVSAR